MGLSASTPSTHPLETECYPVAGTYLPKVWKYERKTRPSSQKSFTVEEDIGFSSCAFSTNPTQRMHLHIPISTPREMDIEERWWIHWEEWMIWRGTHGVHPPCAVACLHDVAESQGWSALIPGRAHRHCPQRQSGESYWPTARCYCG